MKLHRNDPVHFGFEIFNMVAIAMVTMKIKTFFYLIVIKFHRNDPWDV